MIKKCIAIEIQMFYSFKMTLEYEQDTHIGINKFIRQYTF